MQAHLFALALGAAIGAWILARPVSAPFGPHSDAQWRFLTETWLRRNDDGTWRAHYDPRIAEANSISLDALKQTERLLLVTSTWGDGEQGTNSVYLDLGDHAVAVPLILR